MNKDEIKDSLSMASVIQSYGVLVKRGMCSCPFHGADKHPSMKVYPQSYYCFTCHATGDVFTWVQQMDGCGFREAFKKLGGTYEHEESYTQRYQSRKRREKYSRERSETMAELKKQEHSKEMLQIELELADEQGRDSIQDEIYQVAAEIGRLKEMLKGGRQWS